MELYETVLGHGIGIKSAHFYQRWAADLEAAGDLRGADKIYQRGLSEDLDCRDVLDQALQRFQMRAAKIRPDESFCDTNAPQRAVLGRLESRDGRVPAERPQIRPMGENRPIEKPIKEKSTFPVFTGGENEKPRRQLMKEIPDEKARVENEAAPKRWNEAASGKEARPVALTTPFKVIITSLKQPVP
jgi:Mad3/BUB1 homology region 1